MQASALNLTLYSLVRRAIRSAKWRRFDAKYSNRSATLSISAHVNVICAEIFAGPLKGRSHHEAARNFVQLRSTVPHQKTTERGIQYTNVILIAALPQLNGPRRDIKRLVLPPRWCRYILSEDLKQRRYLIFLYKYKKIK